MLPRSCPLAIEQSFVVSRDDALGRVYKVLLTWTGLFGDSAPVAAELHDAGPTCFFDHASDLMFDQRFETYCLALALWRFFSLFALGVASKLLRRSSLHRPTPQCLKRRDWDFRSTRHRPTGQPPTVCIPSVQLYDEVQALPRAYMTASSVQQYARGYGGYNSYRH